MITRKVLITGITGQDGSYLAELLLEKGYEVHGIVRRVAAQTPSARLSRLAGLESRLHLHSGSLESFPSLFQIVHQVQPQECYHLAAQSFVSYSFEDEFSTLQTNINGTHYMLAALRRAAPECRFCFAASSEMFGKAAETPQSETTRFHPRSAYGISKITGFDITRNYREAHSLHASSAILFNHESPRRGAEFVTRKITMAVASIAAGKSNELRLGHTAAKRDWGHARDHARAMWLMLQQTIPEDYVIATGVTHSVQDFLELAFDYAGLKYQDYLRTDESLYRPAEVEILKGNPAKAKQQLGWEPETDFETLVFEMVEADCRDLGIKIKRKVVSHA